MKTTKAFHCLLLALMVASAIASHSCGSSTSETLSPAEAQAIAEEAYIFAYPMLRNYKTMYAQAIDTGNDSQGNPNGLLFNSITNYSKLADSDSKDVVRPNNDTFYSTAWLDLRKEPVVITVPEIADRYYSFQLVDLYTYNFNYIGTRTTGTGAGNYLIAGPSWNDEIPASIKKENVYRTEGNFAYSLTRTGYKNTDSVINNVDTTVLSIQQQYKVQPLSKFLGQTPSVDIPIVFPHYDEAIAETAGFIEYFNFLLGQLIIGGYEPDLYEQELIAKFGKIGIGPNRHFDASSLDSRILQAINTGVKSAINKIQEKTTKLGQSKDGWVLSGRIFGSRETMEQTYPNRQELYLVRAAGAYIGLYGVDLEEAYYPTSKNVGDADGGGTLNTHDYNYMLKFAPGNIPPVRENGFWSITIYNSDQFLVANTITRYSIGDRTEGLIYGANNSLRIYIQKERTGAPGSEEYENWLPAPDGQFSLTMRIYMPADTAYAPPSIQIN